MIVKADKGKTCVIIHTSDYTNKVQSFLDNNFQKLPKDPTDKYQKILSKHYNTVIWLSTKNRWNTSFKRNPRHPLLKHKPDNPIRPVNNINAPAYKISKFLVNKLNDHLNLKYHYNVKNSTTLASDLAKLRIDENHRMITFDIKDLNINIPIKQTLTITKNLLSEHNDEHTIKQILTLLETILQQNYFSFLNITYQPKKGVSMGSPISNTVAEIFLQYLENTHLKQILETKNVLHKICWKFKSPNLAMT
jgi:hypothetical protein